MSRRCNPQLPTLRQPPRRHHQQQQSQKPRSRNKLRSQSFSKSNP